MLLSDYLTKSGREESGGLLGAYCYKECNIIILVKIKKIACKSRTWIFFKRCRDIGNGLLRNIKSVHRCIRHPLHKKTRKNPDPTTVI